MCTSDKKLKPFLKAEKTQNQKLMLQVSDAFHNKNLKSYKRPLLGNCAIDITLSKSIFGIFVKFHICHRLKFSFLKPLKKEVKQDTPKVNKNRHSAKNLL